MIGDTRNKISIPLLVIFLVVSSIILYYSTIDLFPSFIHAWTQSDRYAIALRFLDNGFDIFHPATFNLQTVEGITRVDLPLNEFIVALIMKLAGSMAPAIFRIYTLVISIAGLVFLYLLAKKICRSEIKAWMVVCFAFFSPVYIYYQAGFIPSIPSIACVFAGYYFFFSYKESSLRKHLYFAVAFLLIASLMRLPFVIFLIGIAAQQLFLLIREKRFRRDELIAFAVAFTVFAASYFHNIHLGRMYGNMFLNSLMPAKSFAEFKEITAQMYDQWCLHYFTMWHYILMFVLVLFSVLRFYKQKGHKEEDKKYWFQCLIISIGAVAYFFAMARQYYAHDYYFLDSFFVPVILLFLMVIKDLGISTRKEKLGWGSIFIITCILFLISNINTQAERYFSAPWDRVEITRQNFTGAEKFLDSIGVSKEAKILVIDAYTTNAPLILMNRKGYTVMGTTHKNIGTALQWAEWDLVAIQDIYLVSDVIKNYPHITSMLECIGNSGTVSFYKRSSKPASKTMKEFLNITPGRVVFSSVFNSVKDGHDSLDSLTEFGRTVSVKAAELKSGSGLKMLVSADLMFQKNIPDVQLVASITTGTEQLFYQNFTISDYFRPVELKQSMEFQFVLPEFKTPADELKVYFWNPGKANMEYYNWEVIIYK
ncbi:MAG TPA: glycosyltransferase family 39 protein [Bacteroidia bacterium]|jgi:hypothetical protein